MHTHNHSHIHEGEETTDRLPQSIQLGIKYIVSAIGIVIITTILFFIINPLTFTQFQGQVDQSGDGVVRNYYVGEVVEIEEENQIVRVELVPEFRDQLELENNILETFVTPADQNFYNFEGEILLEPGNRVIIQGTDTTELGGEVNYNLIDYYRIQPIMIILLIFVLVVVAFSWQKGIRSLLGLIMSLGLLMGVMIPAIVYGGDPVLVSILVGGLISGVSLVLSHGFNRGSLLSFFSIFSTIVFAAFLSLFAVEITMMVGNGSEQALFTQTLGVGDIDLRGILLAGIIIGTLGVLDDIATSQVATIRELHIANKDYNLKDLYESAIKVGKTHIASLINTLILAYAGAALPLFIIITYNVNDPLWVVINSEPIVEEIVRTIIGSISLILAVPISTFVAAWWYSRNN